jgi:hypothetical protein
VPNAPTAAVTRMLHFQAMDDLLLIWIPVGLMLIGAALAVPFMLMYAMS